MNRSATLFVVAKLRNCLKGNLSVVRIEVFEAAFEPAFKSRFVTSAHVDGISDRANAIRLASRFSPIQSCFWSVAEAFVRGRELFQALQT